MKKILFFAVAIVAMTLASCGNNATKGDDTIATDSISADTVQVDSVAVAADSTLVVE